MFESEEPEDWHKKFHHDMSLSFFDFNERITQLEKRLAAFEGIEYKPVNKSVDYEHNRIVQQKTNDERVRTDCESIS